MTHKVSLLIIVLLKCYCATSEQPWKLVWREEFNGDALDTSRWFHLLDCSGRGNNELECYTNSTQNTSVRNGTLIITARPEKFQDMNYTSGRIHAKGKGWKYGRFETRAKLPSGKHLWPAIWMVPTKKVYGGWPASGEIDIMESRRQINNKVEGTLHYGESRQHHGHVGSKPTAHNFDFSQDFHVFGFEWSQHLMTWSVDGKPYYSLSLDRSFNTVQGDKKFYTKNGQPFDQHFNWILNLAVGGGYFPTYKYGKLDFDEAKKWAKPTFEVDWLRVYQTSNFANNNVLYQINEILNVVNSSNIS